MGGLAAGMPGKFALASAWKTVATVLCIASDHDTGAVVPAPTSSIRAKVQAWNYVLGAPQINEIPIVSTLGKILVKEVVGRLEMGEEYYRRVSMFGGGHA